MPYIITEGDKPNSYMVRNHHTGKVHSFGSTLENAKKQLKVLEHLQAEEHFEGAGLLYNEKKKKVSLPSTNDIQFIVPPFLVRERKGNNRYRLKLVNPLTKQRNISSREKDLNIQIFRKLTPTADLQFSMKDYDLKEFSPKDRKTILEYDELMSNEWGDRATDYPTRKGFNKVDYKEVPNVLFHNQPRGFPTELPANEGKPMRKGYADIMAYLEGQEVDFNQRKPPPKRRNKRRNVEENDDANDEEEPMEQEEEPMEPVEKRRRGRPRTKPIPPIIAPEDKRPRGRPRTKPIEEEPKEKRPRGRPRKDIVEKPVEKQVENPKESYDRNALRKYDDAKLQKAYEDRKKVLEKSVRMLNENNDPTKVKDLEFNMNRFRVKYLDAMAELEERGLLAGMAGAEPQPPSPKTPKTPKVATPKTPKVATPKTPKVATPKTPNIDDEELDNFDFDELDEIEVDKGRKEELEEKLGEYPKKDVAKIRKLYKQIDKAKTEEKKEKLTDELYEIENAEDIVNIIEELMELEPEKAETPKKVETPKAETPKQKLGSKALVNKFGYVLSNFPIDESKNGKNDWIEYLTPKKFGIKFLAISPADYEYISNNIDFNNTYDDYKFSKNTFNFDFRNIRETSKKSQKDYGITLQIDRMDRNTGSYIPVVADVRVPNKYTPNSKKTTGGKISSNNIMPNRWIEYVRDYASKKGIKYGEALKDPKCKAGYKKGGKIEEDSSSDSDSEEGIHIDIGSHNQGQRSHQGGTLFKIEPGRITHQAGVRGVVLGSKKGRGVIDERVDYGVIAKSTNIGGLGANAGRKFISL
jgi:hypothetical protein